MRRTAQVDVLIPVFNAERTVESAIASIQAQTLRDIRLLVVDDGSTDRSGEVLARIAAQDARVEVLRQPNGGIVDALNAGLARCTAPFVARHDADDLAAPDRFAQQLDYLQAYPGCVAADGYYWIINAQGRRTGAQAFAYGPVRHDATSFPSEEPYLTHPFLMVRRDAMMAVGGYRHAFHSEDSDLYWRLLEYGELRHMPVFVGSYRYHGGSVSSASIVNGRIAAINSQLAALSHRRRQAHGPDFGFPREKLGRYVAAGSLEAMLAIASEPLDGEERHWFRIATCTKLLELASYRPYLLDNADVALIADTLGRADDPLLARVGGFVPRNRGAVALKLMAAGRWRAGRRVSPGTAALLRTAARQAGLAARDLYGRHRWSGAGG